MLGLIFNDSKLSFEDGGCWNFDGNGPHQYWCVINIVDDEILLAPAFFNYVDDLTDSVIECSTYQVAATNPPLTLLVGRCIVKHLDDLTTEPVICLNPILAQEAFKNYAKGLQE
jgi:hypothetical protein